MTIAVLVREVWQSWRASLRRPGFVLLAGLTLALGLGLSVAMFTLVDRLVLASLPYQQPNRLVVIGTGQAEELPARWYGAMRDLPALMSMAYIGGEKNANLSSPGLPPDLVTALPASLHFLPTLGGRLVLGRNFSHAETVRDGPRAVILTYGFWQRRFARRDNVLGSTLRLDGRSYTIIGVLPRSFRWAQSFNLLVPANLHRAVGRNESLAVFGRLRRGSTVQQAGMQADARLRHWLQAHGEDDAGHARVGATLLPAAMVSGYASIFGVTMACTLAVLLLAAVNVTN
ncbi:permease, partial [mine drainage metagenome]